MSRRSTLLVFTLLITLGLITCQNTAPTAAQGGVTLQPQIRAAQQTHPPTPTRADPFVATPEGALIFDFPTPRAIGVQGPIAGQQLSALEKSALAVVKLNGCSQSGTATCTFSDGSGIIIHPRGLILTALHVVIEEPGNLRSPLLPEISVGIVEDPNAPVQSSYRATVAAIDSELDLALLRIIPPADEAEPFFPTLPIENIGNRVFQTEAMRVMGFPQGQTRLKQPSVDFFGLNEDGAVEVEGPLVGRGFSGGPLLVDKEDRYHVGGIVFFRADGPVLVQPIHLLTSLRWQDSEAAQLWIDGVQFELIDVDGLTRLRLAANVHAIDLAERRLRLVAIAFDPEQDQPWPSADESLVLRRTFEPERFIDVLPLGLEASLTGLGPVPERLRFTLQLWDVDESRLLWDGEAHYLATASAPTATPTLTPTGTATPTPAKPTPDAAATEQAAMDATSTAEAIILAVQQSVDATLAAHTPTRLRATPTPTVDTGPAAQEYVLGAAQPFTGPLGAFGTDFGKGIDLAVAQMNEQLAGAGSYLQFVVASSDTEGTPDGAAKAVQAIVQTSGVNVIVGPLTTGGILGAKQYADDNQIVLVAPASSAPAGAIPGDYIFRVMYPPDTFAANAFEQIALDRGYENIAVLQVDDPFGNGMVEAFTQSFQANGGDEVAMVKFAPEPADLSREMSKLSSEVTRLSDAGKTALFIVGFLGDGQKALQLAVTDPALGSVEWLGVENLASPELLADASHAQFLADRNFTSVSFCRKSDAQYPALCGCIYGDARQRTGAVHQLRL